MLSILLVNRATSYSNSTRYFSLFKYFICHSLHWLHADSANLMVYFSKEGLGSLILGSYLNVPVSYSAWADLSSRKLNYDYDFWLTGLVWLLTIYFISDESFDFTFFKEDLVSFDCEISILFLETFWIFELNISSSEVMWVLRPWDMGDLMPLDFILVFALSLFPFNDFTLKSIVLYLGKYCF